MSRQTLRQRRALQAAHRTPVLCDPRLQAPKPVPTWAVALMACAFGLACAAVFASAYLWGRS